MAQAAFRTNDYLLQVGDYLRRTDAPGNIADALEQARRLVSTVLNGLIRAGADDPLQAVIEQERQRRQEAGLPTAKEKSVPLELLSSPAAKRYAEAIRAAAVACRQMEEERYGPDCDGFAESLEDWADIAEMEVYGPKGLRGLE
jgi:hypothetical protein